MARPPRAPPLGSRRRRPAPTGRDPRCHRPSEACVAPRPDAVLGEAGSRPAAGCRPAGRPARCGGGAAPGERTDAAWLAPTLRALLARVHRCLYFNAGSPRAIRREGRLWRRGPSAAQTLCAAVPSAQLCCCDLLGYGVADQKRVCKRVCDRLQPQAQLRAPEDSQSARGVILMRALRGWDVIGHPHKRCSARDWRAGRGGFARRWYQPSASAAPAVCWRQLPSSPQPVCRGRPSSCGHEATLRLEVGSDYSRWRRSLQPGAEDNSGRTANA